MVGPLKGSHLQDSSVIPLWAAHNVNARMLGQSWYLAMPAEHRTQMKQLVRM
jgi:hypothetical protein